MPKPIEPPEHEHSSNCLPGADEEFSCPIMVAFRETLHWLSELVKEADKMGTNRRTVTRYSVDKARAALKQAHETEFNFYKGD